MDRREMKEAYKLYKPDMGVYAYRCKATGVAYIGYGQNLKGDINGITFQLNLGRFYSNARCGLQEEWKRHGEAGFEIEVLERLEYAKDESKTDYQAELVVLREVCAERFSKYEFIQK